jgi:hypothetical protein
VDALERRRVTRIDRQVARRRERRAAGRRAGLQDGHVEPDVDGLRDDEHGDGLRQGSAALELPRKLCVATFDGAHADTEDVIVRQQQPVLRDEGRCGRKARHGHKDDGVRGLLDGRRRGRDVVEGRTGAVLRIARGAAAKDQSGHHGVL